MALWPPQHRTVEDYRRAALDVRELYRYRVFDRSVGTVWRNCALTWPWLRSFRLESASLELELRNGRHVTVPLTWESCGIFYNYWLACPLCRRRVRLLLGSTNDAPASTARGYGMPRDARAQKAGHSSGFTKFAKSLAGRQCCLHRFRPARVTCTGRPITGCAQRPECSKLGFPGKCGGRSASSARLIEPGI